MSDPTTAADTAHQDRAPLLYREERSDWADEHQEGVALLLSDEQQALKYLDHGHSHNPLTNKHVRKMAIYALLVVVIFMLFALSV